MMMSMMPESAVAVAAVTTHRDDKGSGAEQEKAIPPMKGYWGWLYRVCNIICNAVLLINKTGINNQINSIYIISEKQCVSIEFGQSVLTLVHPYSQYVIKHFSSGPSSSDTMCHHHTHM